MINEPILFAKPNNIVECPRKSWGTSTKIYVKGTIDLGLDRKIEFDKDNPITLSKLVRINTALMSQERGFISTLKGRRKAITIETISYNELKVYNGTLTKDLILHYRNWTGQIGDRCNIKILTQLYNTSPNLRCKYILKMRRWEKELHDSFRAYYKLKYELGDKIKYLSEDEEMEGLIYAVNYHSKEDYIYYTVFSNGEIKTRRLLEDEFQLCESTTDNKP